MIAEQLSRSQFQRQLQNRLWELRQNGQDGRHLKSFLARLRAVPGQTVGDMCHNWSRAQAERRPIYQLLWLAMAVLSSALLFKSAGVGASLFAMAVCGVLSVVHLQVLWYEEGRFANELLARADAAHYSLVLTRR
ncbi:MAG: hypothetical protein KF760_32675 [Candidatus Eremiobacteraeota bacterium]|nr:hypothetical protein [Candidatus Eremiobacteraeota bacterium]MCW5871799.1 hypothetical protein [Candidatus Eremiobacteraeota bacterium]